MTIAKGAIPARMFEGSGLTRLTLEAGVTEIGANAFANTALTTADLTGVMEIGEGAFENATLEAVRLNANASVGERAFANTKLTQPVEPTSRYSLAVAGVKSSVPKVRMCASTSTSRAETPETLSVKPYCSARLPGTSTVSKPCR